MKPAKTPANTTPFFSDKSPPQKSQPTTARVGCAQNPKIKIRIYFRIMPKYERSQVHLYPGTKKKRSFVYGHVDTLKMDSSVQLIMPFWLNQKILPKNTKIALLKINPLNPLHFTSLLPTLHKRINLT